MEPLSRSSWPRIVSIAVILLLTVCWVLAFTPNLASAGDFSKSVRGYVYEGDSSHPVEGASVTVQIWKPDNTLRYEYPELLTTDSLGRYSCTIGALNWEIGDTILVTATKAGLGEETGSKVITQNSATAPVEIVNVIFPTAIPQLAGTLGVLVTGAIVGVVAIVALRRKRLEE